MGNLGHPKRPGRIPNPNLFHALAYGTHWLPGVRFQAILYLIELIACLTPRHKREGAKIIKVTATKLYELEIGHTETYKIIYFNKFFLIVKTALT